MRHYILRIPIAAGALLVAMSTGTDVFAQGRAVRPPLFLHEEWKQTPAGGEHPVTPDGLSTKLPLVTTFSMSSFSQRTSDMLNSLICQSATDPSA